MSSGDTNTPSPDKAGFISGMKSFPSTFWVSNWIEVVERFAYYGLRGVLPVFMVLSFEEGGPQFDHVQKGSLYFVWAMVQSFLPALVGGFADRYGYKRFVATSIFIAILGYITMGYAIDIACWDCCFIFRSNKL